MTENNLYKNKNYLLLLVGDVLLNLAFQFFYFTVPLIIYELTQSPGFMSGARALEYLPKLLLAILIGLLIDKANRKKLILLSGLTVLISSILLIILAHWNIRNLFFMYIIIFIISLSKHIKGATMQALLPSIVPKDDLLKANSTISLYITLVTSIGPTVAGYLYAVGGEIYNFYVLAMGTLTFCTLFSFIQVSQDPVPSRKKKISHDLNEGWKELRNNTALWNVTIMILFTNFATAIVSGTLVYYSLIYVGVTEVELGFAITGSTVGGALGAWSIKYFRKKFNTGKVFHLALIQQLTGYSILLFSPHWLTVFFGLTLIGFATTQSNIQFLSLRQKTTPHHVLGRVEGLTSSIMKIFTPFSMVSAGFLAEFINLRYIMVTTIILYCLIILYSNSRNIKSIN